MPFIDPVTTLGEFIEHLNDVASCSDYYTSHADIFKYCISKNDKSLYSIASHFAKDIALYGLGVIQSAIDTTKRHPTLGELEIILAIQKQLSLTTTSKTPGVYITSTAPEPVKPVVVPVVPVVPIKPVVVPVVPVAPVVPVVPVKPTVVPVAPVKDEPEIVHTHVSPPKPTTSTPIRPKAKKSSHHNDSFSLKTYFLKTILSQLQIVHGIADRLIINTILFPYYYIKFWVTLFDGHHSAVVLQIENDMLQSINSKEQDDDNDDEAIHEISEQVSSLNNFFFHKPTQEF